MAFVIYTDEGPPKILYFDVIKREQHEGEQAITEYSVEAGADLSDHARKKNDVFTFDGVISRTPLKRDGLKGHGLDLNLILNVKPYVPPPDFTPAGAIAAGLQALNPPDPATPIIATNVLQFTPYDPILEMQAELDALIGDHVLCTVTTFTKSYRSMLLQRYEMPVERLGAVTFTCTFKAVRIVESSLVAAPQPKEPRGTPSAKAGAAGPGTPIENQSFTEMATALSAQQPALARALGLPAFLTP